MYEIVDAVNQQIRPDAKPEQLLILTKLAELMPSMENPVWRISKTRLAVITHLHPRTVQRHLNSLVETGELKVIEGEDVEDDQYGKLYLLKLPEGFDRKVIGLRRGHYYSGKWMSAREQREAEKRTLSPVLKSEVEEQAQQHAITGAEANSPIRGRQNASRGEADCLGGGDKLPPGGRQIASGGETNCLGGGDKLPPIKNIENISQKEINNNNNEEKPDGTDVVVVDGDDEEDVDYGSPFVKAACEDAAAATGASAKTFLRLGMDERLRDFLGGAVEQFRKAKNQGTDISDPARYLMGIVKKKAQTYAMNGAVGKIRRDYTPRQGSGSAASASDQSTEGDKYAVFTKAWDGFCTYFGFVRWSDLACKKVGNNIMERIPKGLTAEEVEEWVDRLFKRLYNRSYEGCASAATLNEIVMGVIGSL